MKTLIFLICILIVSQSLGIQTKTDTLSKLVTESTLSTKIETDTLRIQLIDSQVQESKNVWYKDNNMPWIIALVISILGIAINLLISNQQIRANRETTLRQIKATLNTSNRQEWVTETRNIVTELMTQAKLLNIEFQEPTSNLKETKAIHEKVTYNRSKLLLLLKPDKPLHKNLLDAIAELMTTLDEHLLNKKAKEEQGLNIPFNNGKFLEQINKVLYNGRILLYDEWGKIQSIA